jgi:hypothetical protein
MNLPVWGIAAHFFVQHPFQAGHVQNVAGQVNGFGKGGQSVGKGFGCQILVHCRQYPAPGFTAKGLTASGEDFFYRVKK